MTVEKVYNVISLLEGLDPEHEYAYEIAFRAFVSMGGLPAIVYNFNRKIDIFRTRTHDEDVLFAEITEIMSPPRQIITSFARCNRPHQSKFYGSENRQTSYIELVNSWEKKKEVGDNLFVTVGHWLIDAPLSAFLVINPDIEGRKTEFDIRHGAGYDNMIKDFPQEIQQACHVLYAYLFQKFRSIAYDDPLVYVITSAYCNAVLSTREENIDAICYPSVPYKEQGLNFAINLAYINPKNIALQGAMRNRFTVGISDGGKKAFSETEAILAKGVDLEIQLINW